MLLRVILLLSLLSLLNGCGKGTESTSLSTPSPTPDPSKPWEADGPPVPTFPDRPAQMQEIAPGVEYYEFTMVGTGPALPMRVLVYLPKGRTEPKSLPCVFIAPAGAAYWGMRFVLDDRPEHLPYVQAGFAVVAYEVTGALTPEAEQNKTYKNILPSVEEFIHADGGLKNGELAIDYALAKLPEVDPDRLYACGHSSAGTQALNLCRADPRIAACCAYAPALDVEKWWDDPTLEAVVPELKEFAARKSPLRHVDEYNKPIFLFHADDDGRVPLEETVNFVEAMTQAHKPLTFQRVSTGNHYDSMINVGVPSGIHYLVSQGADPKAPLW